MEARLRSGLKRGQPTCTPGTRRHGRTLWTKPGRSLWHLGAQRWHVEDLRIGDGSATPPRRWSQRGIGVTNHTSWSCFGTVLGSGGRQRQEGNGRSDAERLPARGMLRRVRTALRETVVTTRRDHSSLDAPGAWTLGSAKQVRRGQGRETQRTLSAPGCNMPGAQSGASRRGGGNPRGRNGMCSGWSRHTEGRWQHRPGVDALGPNG